MDSSQAAVLLQTMRSIYQRHLLTDLVVTLESDPGNKFSVHKAMMATFCGYFRQLLEQGKLEQQQELKGIRKDVFSVLVDFIYTGKLDTSRENITDVMETSRLLDMPSVLETCDSLLKSQSSDLSFNQIELEESADVTEEAISVTSVEVISTQQQNQHPVKTHNTRRRKRKQSASPSGINTSDKSIRPKSTRGRNKKTTPPISDVTESEKDNQISEIKHLESDNTKNRKRKSHIINKDLAITDKPSNPSESLKIKPGNLKTRGKQSASSNISENPEESGEAITSQDILKTRRRQTTASVTEPQDVPSTQELISDRRRGRKRKLILDQALDIHEETDNSQKSPDYIKSEESLNVRSDSLHKSNRKTEQSIEVTTSEVIKSENEAIAPDKPKKTRRSSAKAKQILKIPDRLYDYRIIRVSPNKSLYQCHTCNARFLHHSSRKLHMKTHNILPPTVKIGDCLSNLGVLDCCTINKSTDIGENYIRSPQYDFPCQTVLEHQNQTNDSENKQIETATGNLVTENNLDKFEANVSDDSNHEVSGNDQITRDIRRETAEALLMISPSVKKSAKYPDLIVQRRSSALIRTVKSNPNRNVVRIFQFQCSGGKYNCKLCDEDFPLYLSYKRHYYKEHRMNLSCKSCRVNFLTKQAYKAHRNFSHLDLQKIRNLEIQHCKRCLRQFIHGRILRRHSQTLHKGQKVTFAKKLPVKLYCINCKNSFPSKKTFFSHSCFAELNHEKLHPKHNKHRQNFIYHKNLVLKMISKTRPNHKNNQQKRKYKCLLCGTQIDGLYHARIHASYRHPECVTPKDIKLNVKYHSLLECKEPGCTFLTNQKQALHKHMVLEHVGQIQNCPSCDYTTYFDQELAGHYQKHHGSAGRVCEICGKFYKRKKHLRIHMVSKHGQLDPGVKEKVCSEDGCDYVCYDNSSMLQHRLTHKEEKNYPCPHCSKTLKSKLNLDKHMKKVHLGIRPYICDQCGSNYGEESELKAHIARHSGEPNYFCDHCDYSAVDKGNYKSHMWSRHKIALEKHKLFVCEVCQYTTDRKTRFTEHVNGHKNVRSHSCPHCGKEFITRNTLKGHIRWVHTAKNLQCPHCEHKTSTMFHLKEHVRVMHTHRDCKPYKCGYCDFHSATSGNCRKHCINKHKGRTVQWIKVMDIDRSNIDLSQVPDTSEAIIKQSESTPDDTLVPVKMKSLKMQEKRKMDTRKSKSEERKPEANYKAIHVSVVHNDGYTQELHFQIPDQQLQIPINVPQFANVNRSLNTSQQNEFNPVKIQATSNNATQRSDSQHGIVQYTSGNTTQQSVSQPVKVQYMPVQQNVSNQVKVQYTPMHTVQQSNSHPVTIQNTSSDIIQQNTSYPVNIQYASVDTIQQSNDIKLLYSPIDATQQIESNPVQYIPVQSVQSSDDIKTVQSNITSIDTQPTSTYSTLTNLQILHSAQNQNSNVMKPFQTFISEIPGHLSTQSDAQIRSHIEHLESPVESKVFPPSDKQIQLIPESGVHIITGQELFSHNMLADNKALSQQIAMTTAGGISHTYPETSGNISQADMAAIQQLLM